MKKAKRLLYIFILVYFTFYFIGTLNICLGSNSLFFNTAFDYVDSLWYCSQNNIYAVVHDGNEYLYMELIDCNTNENYILLSLDNQTVELYKASKIDCITKTAPLYRTRIKYYKKWGKIYKFKIENINFGNNSDHLGTYIFWHYFVDN